MDYTVDITPRSNEFEPGDLVTIGQRGIVYSVMPRAAGELGIFGQRDSSRANYIYLYDIKNGSLSYAGEEAQKTLIRVEPLESIEFVACAR